MNENSRKWKRYIQPSVVWGHLEIYALASEDEMDFRGCSHIMVARRGDRGGETPKYVNNLFFQSGCSLMRIMGLGCERERETGCEV